MERIKGINGIKLDEFEQELWARANVGLSHSLTLDDAQLDALASEFTYSPAQQPEMRTIPEVESSAAIERLGELVLDLQNMLDPQTKEANLMRSRYALASGSFELEAKVKTSIDIAEELKEAISG